MTIKSMLAVMAAPAALLAASPVLAQDDPAMQSDTQPAPMQDEMADPAPMTDAQEPAADPMAEPMTEEATMRVEPAQKMEIKPKDFTMAAAHSGHFEIESSKLAMQNSDNQEVRDYAQKMIADHEAMNEELKAVGKGRVPKEAGPAQKIVVADLSGKTGTEFDEGYIKGQVTGHEMTVAVFEAMAQDDAEPELQEFAQTGLPKLREHLEDAKAIATNMGAM